jgi:cytochrome P450
MADSVLLRFAGADSTSSTMQTFLWYVLANPSIHQRLVSEIESVNSTGLLSEMITFGEATTKLPYFQACLKEAMRIGPAVGLNITRFVPSPHGKVDGHVLRGGTRVALNAWVLHRDRETFGEDADKYVPERWILDEQDDKNKERLTTMERCMFQFGGGSHLCIGRHLALLEMNKLLPQLLRRYKFQLVNPEKPLDHHSSFFVVQKGLLVNIKKR